MSSFMCEDKTVNRIISFLVYDKIGKEAHKIIKKVTGIDLEIKGSDEIYEAQVNLFGVKLRDLNIKALNERYGDNIEELNEQYPFNGFDWKAETPSRMQMLKSLGCFTYQCNEGNIDKTAIFKMLRQIELSLAYDIITDAPEYDEAEWG